MVALLSDEASQPPADCPVKRESRTRMKGFVFLLLIPLLVSGAFEALPPVAEEVVTPFAPWTAKDYTCFTPTTFRLHPPALRAMDRDNLDYALLNAAIFFVTNAQREKQKLPLFQPSRSLTECAFEHSRDMVLQKFFSHENAKDASKHSPWQRMEAKGVIGGYRAENIAMLSTKGMTYLACADAVVKQWMNSSGHRANILNPKLSFLGCGAYACACSKFHLHATQNFSSGAPD